MNPRPASRGPGQIEAYLLALSAELQHIEASLFRMRHCTERLLAAHEAPEPDTSLLERMYEDLERAIHAPASPETEPRPMPTPLSSAHGRRRKAGAARPRVVLLNPSLASGPADKTLQVVPVPARKAATSSAIT